jgi:hypothetical protein
MLGQTLRGRSWVIPGRPPLHSRRRRTLSVLRLLRSASPVSTETSGGPRQAIGQASDRSDRSDRHRTGIGQASDRHRRGIGEASGESATEQGAVLRCAGSRPTSPLSWRPWFMPTRLVYPYENGGTDGPSLIALVQLVPGTVPTHVLGAMPGYRRAGRVLSPATPGRSRWGRLPPPPSAKRLSG